MLYLSTGGRRLRRAALSFAMYATRIYSTPGGGAGVKQGRRSGLALMEVPHPPQAHLPHHTHPSPSAYHLYQGRPDTHRGAHFHHHYHSHLQPAHLPPPPLLPHYQHHAHFHTYGGGAPGGSATAVCSKKKTWNFIHEKMSYDTFFTLKRLIERSRRPDEVLRWVTQNPTKISHNHYPVALQKIGQLLQASPPHTGDVGKASEGGGADGGDERKILEHQDFHTLCGSIVNDCAKFDNFSVVNCLYAVAALGLSSESQVVQVLEAQSQSRLNQFNQKDVSMVFSSSMKLHPGTQHPLTEACLASLEKNLEREHHPQTLFLLLSYYRVKWRSLREAAAAAVAGSEPATNHSRSSPNRKQLLTNRKILNLVKHTLASVSVAREQEMALLDEMLAACAQEACNRSLEQIFSSHLFYQNRLEKFISSLAEELPKKVDSVTPHTMSLIAKYVARHRLRETQLLDTIADFLVKKATYLDSKVIQKLVFPFSRMSYHPSNQQQFFSRLDEVVKLKALSSPLATVNILMSLFQLGHFPGLVLHRVFSPAFINNVTNSPYALIVRRYLSLLDAAVELEYCEYTGPRLQDTHKVLLFDHALTADEVNRKYSYKGLVAEALRQLVGEHNYKQDEVLAPGYYTDFLLWIDGSGRVLPIRTGAGLALNIIPSPCIAVATKPADAAAAALTSEFQRFSPFATLDEGGEDPCQSGNLEPKSFLAQHIRSPAGASVCSGPPRPGANDGPLDYGPYYVPAPENYSSLAKEHSLESQDSSTLSSPPSDGLPPLGSQGPAGATATDSLFQFSIGEMLEEEGAGRATGSQNTNCELQGFYEGTTYAEASSPPVPPADQRPIRRVIMSVNDKWHYCHNSEVLVGSRAMRYRHLRLLGYDILQLPYLELEKLNGIEEVKQYLHKKLLDIPL